MLKRTLYIVITVVLILHIGILSAAQINGVYFNDSVTVDNKVLQLRGAGMLKWLFFKVYVTALYLPPDVPNSDVLDDVPKQMIFDYFSDMKAEHFTESGEPLLRDNATADEIDAVRDKIDRINSIYRNVKEGERYSLTYLPSKGTELALNGEVLGRIPGYDFASVYYRIWLGENPVDEALKRDLLAKGQEVS